MNSTYELYRLQSEIEMPLYYACLQDGNITKQQLEKMIKAAAYTVLIKDDADVNGNDAIIDRLVKKMMKDEEFLTDMNNVLNTTIRATKVTPATRKTVTRKPTARKCATRKIRRY